jgi:hypothetical protein
MKLLSSYGIGFAARDADRPRAGMSEVPMYGGYTVGNLTVQAVLLQAA